MNLWKQKKTKRAGCKRHPALFFFAAAIEKLSVIVYTIQQTQNKGGIAQVLNHFLGESHAILIQEHIRVGVDAEWSKKFYDLIVPYITADWQ